MALEGRWFSEVDGRGGSAFSLSVTEKLHEERSEFQLIEIYQTETFGRLMVIDGCIMLSERDNFLYHEMMTHPALFSHNAPREVAIIGGGDCGTLREVLRHDEVEHAIQVEIDERVTRLSEQYFPSLCEANDDPRAELYFGDGIAWMSERPAGSLDLVIIDSTDPVGPALGLFSESFYQDVYRALRPGGLLVQQTESPLYHLPIIQGVRAGLRRAGFADIQLLSYPQPVYPSGWWTATLAGRDGQVTFARQDVARSCPFATQYYSADIHQAALAVPPFVANAFAEND